MNSRLVRYVSIMAGLVAVFVLPIIIRDRYFQHILVLSCIFVLLTASWNLLAGYAGLLNLGHAAFYGIGAYSSALITMNLHLSPWLGLFLGGIVAAIFGILLGIPSLRLSGPYLAITTIGFSEIMRMVAMNWVSLTRGSLGLYGIPPLTPIRLSEGFSIEFVSERNAYYVVVILVILAAWLIRKLIRSEFGITLKSMREDESGAESIGINTSQYKLTVFMMSAFLAGLAGSFYAHYVRLISPEMLTLGETFAVLTMAMVGGLGTLSGPVVGAVLLIFFSEGLRFLEELIQIDIRLIIYGSLLIMTILFMRNGVIGLLTELGKHLYGKPEEKG